MRALTKRYGHKAMKTISSVLYTTLLFIFLALIYIPVANATVHKTQSPKTKITSNEAISHRILVYVNQYRASRGLKPLRMNDRMSKEATIHSRDMATHKIPFGHQYFSGRIKRLYHQIPLCRGGAENVAYNYKDLQYLVQEWTKSPGHKKNIIGNYNLTGIGIARDRQGKMYYTQMFIRSDA